MDMFINLNAFTEIHLSYCKTEKNSNEEIIRNTRNFIGFKIHSNITSLLQFLIKRYPYFVKRLLLLLLSHNNIHWHFGIFHFHYSC